MFIRIDEVCMLYEYGYQDYGELCESMVTYIYFCLI